MSKTTYRVARPWLLAIVLTLTAAVCLGCTGIWRARTLLLAALDGRKTRTQEEAYVSEFALRAQMYSGQAAARVSGWHAVVQQEEVDLTVDGQKRYARVYAPINGQDQAPWAIVLHGGLGTDGTQLIDVACELSLAGYCVLLPDLRAHGRSSGEISFLGSAEKMYVCAWADWIKNRDSKAKIVVYGMDEGAVAALMAAPDLHNNVAAIAADSAYLNTQERASQLLEKSRSASFPIDHALFEAAYGLLIRQNGLETDVIDQVKKSCIPLLIISGTGDETTPAWHSEDIAQAAGEWARLLLIEGAAHEEARFLNPQEYSGTLLGFFESALE